MTALLVGYDFVGWVDEAENLSDSEKILCLVNPPYEQLNSSRGIKKHMPEYRRVYIPGGTYFFTVVTFNRMPIFANPQARVLLDAVMLKTKSYRPYQTGAYCILPDHLHYIWTLPEGDADYSTRWKEIKRLFSSWYLKHLGPGGNRNTSRRKHKEAANWQRRFWEHAIRDQEDFNNHVAYIHFNPVKHGLVKQVKDWPWSSFHRYVETGMIDKDWGGVDIDLAAGE